MPELSRTDQRRITFLSLLSSASISLNPEDAYAQASEWLVALENDGLFESNPTPQRSERSARPASSSRPSNRGRDSGRPAFTGQMQNPTGPPSDKQVNLALKLTNDYTEDELWEMTKEEVSNIISDNKKF
jgi:hypothetical protein